MVSFLKFKSLSYLCFFLDIWYEVWIKFNLFPNGYPVVPKSLIRTFISTSINLRSCLYHVLNCHMHLGRFLDFNSLSFMYQFHIVLIFEAPSVCFPVSSVCSVMHCSSLRAFLAILVYLFFSRSLSSSRKRT